MRSKAKTPNQYISELPTERAAVMSKLRREIKKNLPKGFKEAMGYGMIGYVIPHSLYPGGYHCDPTQPLPFMSLASQKNYISLYHMAVYNDNELGKWFRKEYEKSGAGKLDMGKGCIRFKNLEHIPYKLIGELSSKITPQEWIAIYEKSKPIK